MQLELLGGLTIFLILSMPIVLICYVLYNCIHEESPRTDRIYIWTEQLESSARRLKLEYVSDGNIQDAKTRIAVEDLTYHSRSHDAKGYEPSCEPKLPFGRYDPPQYQFKELTSLGLELWTKRMHAKVDSFNIDKRCHMLYREAQEELRQIGMTIIEAQETITGVVYAGGINASGYDNSVNERVIVKIRIYGTKKAPVSVIELSVFSRDEEQVRTLCEQIKQSLWQ